jgi:hypothetical protein
MNLLVQTVSEVSEALSNYFMGIHQPGILHNDSSSNSLSYMHNITAKHLNTNADANYYS